LKRKTFNKLVWEGGLSRGGRGTGWGEGLSCRGKGRGGSGQEAVREGVESGAGEGRIMSLRERPYYQDQQQDLVVGE